MSVSKYTRFDSAPDSSHNLAMSLIPREARVLEFGCATGYMSAALKSRLGCAVTGVELSPQAGELARENCERVIIGDAERLDYREVFRGMRFDAILFVDVLEHLREPGAVLEHVRPLLAEGGGVIASIPNVAHGSVRLALLHGEFRYRELGLLDNTHLRFFTRDTIQELFEGAGYIITHWLRKRVDIQESEIAVPFRRAPQGVEEWLSKDPEATTYQFIVRAVPSDAAEQLRQLRTELASVRFELSATQQALQQALANGSPQPGKNSGHRQPTWIEQRHLATLEITALIPPDDTFILVDGDEWATGDTVAGRRRIPFLERDGQYWGPPSDDEVAVCNLERLRQAGASFIVFAWPAFWWLDCYQRFNGYLRAQFCCILENERVIVFDLRKTMQMDKRGVYIDEHRHPSDTSLRTGNRATG